MTIPPRILIVHASEDVAPIKAFLLEKFPALERPDQIRTTHIDFLYHTLIGKSKESFDILIATENTPRSQVEETLQALKDRKIPLVIGKVILPESKLIEIDLDDWEFSLS